MGCKGLKWLVLKRFIKDQKTALRAGSKRRPVGPVASIIVENPETKNLATKPQISTPPEKLRSRRDPSAHASRITKKTRGSAAASRRAQQPNSPIVPSSPATWTMNRRVA